MSGSIVIASFGDGLPRGMKSILLQYDTARRKHRVASPAIPFVQVGDDRLTPYEESEGSPFMDVRYVGWLSALHLATASKIPITAPATVSCKR